jgi:hypothetical protein
VIPNLADAPTVINFGVHEMENEMKTHLPPKRAKGRWYCGPYAIGVVTGASFEDVRAAVNDRRNRPANTGVCYMYDYEIDAALGNLGCGMDKVYGEGVKKNRITLKSWLKRPRNEGHVYIVVLTSHFVVVTDDWLIDNHTNGKVNIAYAPHLRSKVKAVYKAFRKDGVGWG